MKRTNLVITLVLLGVSVSFLECGSDPAPAVDPHDAQLTKLSQTWKATTVTFDGVSVSGYSSFTLTVSGTPGNKTFNYTTTGRPTGPNVRTPWPPAGTFTFGTDFATVVVREDLVPVTYSVPATATQLQLIFEYSGAGFTGRVGAVEGDWVFNFGL